MLAGQIAVQLVAERIGRAPAAPPAALGRARDGIEAPHQRAGRRIVRRDETADAVLRAADADDDLAVRGHRRAVDGVRLLVVGHAHAPHGAACPGVEGHEAAVERPHVDPSTVGRDAAIHRSAAVDGGGQRLREFPELASRSRVEGHDVVERGRDVHDAVRDNWAGLERMRQAGVVAPRQRESATRCRSAPARAASSGGCCGPGRTRPTRRCPRSRAAGRRPHLCRLAPSRARVHSVRAGSRRPSQPARAAAKQGPRIGDTSAASSRSTGEVVRLLATCRILVIARRDLDHAGWMARRFAG